MMVVPFSSFLLSVRLPPSSTLFPYTTLFRSRLPRRRRGQDLRGHPAPRQDRPRAAQGPGQEGVRVARRSRSEEHTSELQSPYDLVCRLLLEKKKFVCAIPHTITLITACSNDD